MLKQFFILCSGADLGIIKHCSNAEQNKYAGIGGTIFFTAIMAFIASGYALYTIFNNLFTSILFALIWGLLIFNLDRYIVGTIKKSNNKINELLQATPRLILAIIIAVVISKPLELKIFEKEINKVLLENINTFTLNNKNLISQQFTPELTELTRQINELNNSVKSKENEVNTLYDIYINEAEGTSGTKKLGKGPVYKEKRAKHDSALAELKKIKQSHKIKIDTLDAKIAKLKTKQEETIASSQPIIDNYNGLMARIEALKALPWWPSFFIFLLFVAIETSPIIAKLLASKSEYDFKLEDYEDKIRQRIILNINERKELNTAHSKLNNDVYSNISNNKGLEEYKSKKTIEHIKQQIDTFTKSNS